MKKSILAVLLAAMTLFTAGCNFFGGEDSSSSSSDSSVSTEKEVRVWSTYNTAKVIRQTTKNEKYTQLPAEISVQMMRGEYEGAQLVLTSNTEVAYTLAAGELKNENGTAFPAQQIAVYHQKYIEISRNYNGNPAYNAGDAIPDMLLPMDIAVAYGENVVQADSNQGVTVEFNSDGVEAGVYTGNFVLEIDGEKQNIPVRIEVWDIEYTGRRTFQSSFLIYRDQLPAGEYDNTKDVVDTYIDFLQEYKADVYVTRDIYEEEHFYESVERFAHKNASSIIIPVDFPLDYKAEETDAHFQEALGYIVWLANQSTEENMYIEYAYFYPSTYDEADVVAERKAAAAAFFEEGGSYAQTLEAAAKKLSKDTEFKKKSAELQERILEAVRNIPAIFTNVYYNAEWVENFDTAFCPYISLFDDVATRQRFQDAATENANGYLWAYSCSDPDYPYPTFHIDDTALGMRVNGWMNKAYDINGYLYYSVNKYSMMHDDTPNTYVDVYGEASRYNQTNGDGFLLYPGKYYGSEAPFASLRLVAYRDGMDDYDMLCVYENLLKEKAEKYGVELDFDDYVADLYNTLFNGVQAYADDALVYQAKEELANRILALQNEDGLVMNLSRQDGKKILRIYTTAQTVMVNGKEARGTAQGDGYCYAVEQGEDAAVFTIKAGKNEYTYSVGAHKVVSADTIQLSEGSVQEKTDGKTVVTIKAIDDPDDPDNRDFLRPSVTYSVGGLANVQTLRFSYANVGEEELEMRITLLTTDGKKIRLATNYCGVGDEREVALYIGEAYDVDWAKVRGVEISFENTVLTETGTVLANDRKIALGDLWFDIQ